MCPSAKSTFEVTWHFLYPFSSLFFFYIGFSACKTSFVFPSYKLHMWFANIFPLLVIVNLQCQHDWICNHLGDTPPGLSEKLFATKFSWGGTWQTRNLRQWAKINPLSLCCFSQVHCHSAKMRWVNNTPLRRTSSTDRVKAKAPGMRGSPHFPAHRPLYSLFFAVLFRNYEPCLASRPIQVQVPLLSRALSSSHLTSGFCSNVTSSQKPATLTMLFKTLLSSLSFSPKGLLYFSLATSTLI